MRKTGSVDMTQGNPMKLLFHFTIPLILGNIFQLTYNTVDTIIVGRFASEGALAAVGTCDPIMSLLILGVSGICVGASVLMSNFLGAGKYDQLKQEFQTTLILGSFFALFVLVSGFAAAEHILRILQTPDAIMKDSAVYLRVIFLGMPFNCIYNIYSAALRSIGDSRTPVRYLVISSVINMVLDVLFVAGFGWDVFGAGFATVIAQAVSAVLCVIYVSKHVTILHFDWKKAGIDKNLAKKTISYGGLTALQQCSQPIGKLCIQGTVNALDSVATIAAFNAIGKIEDIGLLPGRSISDAIMTFVAQNDGSGNKKRIKKGFRQGIFLEFLAGILVCVTVCLFRNPLMHLFTSDPEIVKEGIAYFAFMAFMYWLPCMTNGHQGYFRGTGAMKTVLGGTLTQITLRVIATMILVPQIGVTGVGFACVIGWSAQCAWQIPYSVYKSNHAIKESIGEHA